jgi:hypothetical protein
MSNTQGLVGAKPCCQTLSSKPCLPSRLVSVLGKVDAPRNSRCAAMISIELGNYPSYAEFFGEPYTWPPSHRWSTVVRRTSIMSGNNQSQCMAQCRQTTSTFRSWYKHKLCRLRGFVPGTHHSDENALGWRRQSIRQQDCKVLSRCAGYGGRSPEVSRQWGAKNSKMTLAR